MTHQHMQTIRTIITPLIFFSLCCISTFAYTNAYTKINSKKIESLIEENLPDATVAILIKDAKTNQTLYQKNQNKHLAPASSTKLFTAAAALYYFAPNHQFQTCLSKKTQTYYLTFSGDPSLTTEALTKLLSHANPKNNLIIDVSRFSPPYYPDGTSYDDLGWYYAAPDTAAILDENMASYTLKTTIPGQAVQIESQDAHQKLMLINDIKTVSPETAKQHCDLNIELKPRNTLRLFGCLPARDTPKSIKLAVPDPILLAQNTIKNNNIVELGKTPNDAKRIACIASDDLITLIKELLQHSNNLYASSLTKQLGYAITKEGTNKQGIFAIKSILNKHTNLNTNTLALADGVGTRYNLINTESFVTLLTNLYQNETLRPLILSALPRAGVSGNLTDRFKNTPLENHLFAKTGSMHDISSLSGYIMHPKGNPLVFSIIINGITKPLQTAKTLEEQILLEVIKAQDSQDLASPS